MDQTALRALAPLGVLDDAVDAVGLRVKVVVGKLVADVERDQEAGGNADGKAADVDGRVAEVAAYISKGDAQVVAERW